MLSFPLWDLPFRRSKSILYIFSVSFFFFNWSIFAVHDYMLQVSNIVGFPGSASGKEPTCQSRRHKRLGFCPWVGMIPWRRAWPPTPLLLPGESPWTGESGGLQPTGLQSWTRLEWLSMHAHIMYWFTIFEGYTLLIVIVFAMFSVLYNISL